ncbi:diacylglycerol acyltransferase [Conidiobolus coronatus NRRL 28638]|uniref:diacylglycerol O-acyltransferase n=1 Tax=Conidiobolus coronatus (strain ATCC 28846 / CBS 209.66 / NRRL 28638) TaxID=796925 RepID=A0A137NUY0_CONC2|nr:diacylglycerol acyltransferase [Conidiobolus coronatus NRRL 28638]|eukprot:KXN66471.1 diacylglycerol acyltransferase [Conidiobolus coronatus NRRL 28638]
MFKEYFDMKIIKTSDILPTKNYIFAYHPHGIVPYGMFSAMNSNCCGFDELYPGIKLNLKVGAVNLGLPLLKEIGLYFGVQLVSKKSIKKTLAKEGNSVVLNVGGGAEMIFSVPGTAKLIIKNRYGFIKIALETGSDLVPVYAFGENSTYNQSPVDQTSSNFWLKREFYKKTNFFLPMISGRGIFPNTKGAFPLNVPIRIVVGKPINVEKVERPTEEQIHEFYDKYCSELEALYNEYKDEFWYDKNSQPPKLELLENPLR